ncbi:hypothetical protein PFLuk1_02883 [Pseudomonas fluorescens]|nr:hypothetical protein PFLuk1_02883 [Pseudomonas fluorescens]
MAGEDKVPGRTSTAHQRQAKQRRGIQGKTAFAFGLGQRVEIGVGVFDHLQLQVDLTLDQLMSTVQAQPMEAAAQDVVTIQCGLPGTSEGEQIKALDVEAQLVDIGLCLGFQQGVEQHALLHRRQRIKVGNRQPGHGQGIQLLLGEACQREIRGAHLACRRGTAMLDQRLEFGCVLIRQPLHSRRLEHLPTEPPLQRQLAAIHLTFQRQPVGQRRLWILGLATALTGRHEQCRLVELTVELAQVVERDARRGKVRQAFLRVWRAQVAQQAVTQAFVGHGAQLFLDRFDRLGQLAFGMQAHRVQAGEPADGATQVDVVEEVFATMAFQLNERSRLLAPTADHPRQGGQQQVVDLGAIGRWRVLQQSAGVLDVEACFQLGTQAVLQAAFGVITRQFGVDGLGLPVRQLLLDGLRVAVQLLRPALVGTGFCRQHLFSVSLLQVFKQDAPRHAIHHQVMDHQQQTLAAIGPIHQRGAQQRALGKVKAALGFITQHRQFSVGAGLALPQQRFADIGGMALLPAVSLLHKAQAQSVVMLDQPRQRGLQPCRLKHLTGHQQQRLIPVMPRRDRLGEKTVLHGRQHHLATDRALVDQADLLEARHQGQAADALVLEQVTRAQANAGLTGAADHLDGDDRIAAQLEKVIVLADLLNAQHVAPDGGQGCLQVALGGDKCLRLSRIRRWQRLAVELAVGGHRQLGQRNEMRRHHVFRQAAEQPGLEVRWRLACVHQIGDQLLAALYQYHGFAHVWMLHQACFDFAQLDTQAAQFDLMIEAAEVFDHPIGALAHAVTGAIQALARHERAGHETFGSQRRASVVTARQANAAQVEFATDTGRHRVELRVQHVGAEVGDGAADGHAVGAFVDAGPVRDVDGRLGRAIEVIQRRSGQLGEHLLLRIQGQGFAAADDARKACARLYARLMDKRLQHRRHEVQGGNGVPTNGVDQARRFTVFARRRDHQAGAGHQWPEELPHRHVEAERGFLQHRVVGTQAIRLLHPAQAVDQGAMAIAGAFGLAGGARGVDHVGQVKGMQGHVRRFAAVAVEP